MKKSISLLIAAAALMGLSACNTVAGLGEDIQAAGKGLENTSEAVEEELTDGGR